MVVKLIVGFKLFLFLHVSITTGILAQLQATKEATFVSNERSNCLFALNKKLPFPPALSNISREGYWLCEASSEMTVATLYIN